MDQDTIMSNDDKNVDDIKDEYEIASSDDSSTLSQWFVWLVRYLVGWFNESFIVGFFEFFSLKLYALMWLVCNSDNAFLPLSILRKIWGEIAHFVLCLAIVCYVL